MAAVNSFDALLIRHLGQFGRYQRFMFVTLSLVAVGVSWHNLIHVFTGAVPDHWCSEDSSLDTTMPAAGILLTAHLTTALPPGAAMGNLFKSGDDLVRPTDDSIIDDGQNQFDLSLANYQSQDRDLIHITQVVPVDPKLSSAADGIVHIATADVNEDYDAQCYTYYTVNGSLDSNSSGEMYYKPCEKWTYDLTQYKSSIATEWDLVCSRKWLGSFVQSLHMAGCLVGSLVFGDLSDRFGRRKLLLVATVMEVGVGLAMVFSPGVWVYGACRFLIGMAIAGQFNCAYIISIELLGPKWRGIAGIMMLYFSSFGIMTLAALAWFIREWRTLQLVIASITTLLLSFFVISPESPRWLIAHKKSKAAKKLITKIAKINKKNVPENAYHWLDDCKKLENYGSSFTKQYSMADLFKTPNIRYRTLSLTFQWFTISVTYYGLCLYTSNLGGNEYLNFFLSGVVELPAYTFTAWCMNRFGRREPLALSMIFGGVALILTSPIPDEMQIARVVLSLLGKLGISVAFVIIYPFSVEMFPTVIRTNGLGFSAMGARIGGFVAPYILLLGEFNGVIPLVVCGALSLFGGCMASILPETYGSDLPDTIAEAEKLPNNTPWRSLQWIRRKLKGDPEPRPPIVKMDMDLEVKIKVEQAVEEPLLPASPQRPPAEGDGMTENTSKEPLRQSPSSDNQGSQIHSLPDEASAATTEV